MVFHAICDPAHVINGKRFSAPPKPRTPPKKNTEPRPPPPPFVASVWTYPPANDEGWYIRRFNMLQSPRLVIFHHPGQKFKTYLSKRRNTFFSPTHKKISGLGSKPSKFISLVMSLKLVYIYRVFGLLGPENPNYPITSMGLVYLPNMKTIVSHLKTNRM